MDSTTELAIAFFTTLTVLANLATVTVAGTAAASALRRDPTSRPGRAWYALRREVTERGAVGTAWLVAAVATVGSLYFSEGAGFVPCRLCWIQRGFMYPLVAVLAVVAVGLAAGRPGLVAWARRVGLAMAVGGAGVAAYHLAIERYPELEAGSACDPSTPCSVVWFERLGFVTLPFMALSAFGLVAALLLVARHQVRTRLASERQRERRDGAHLRTAPRHRAPQHKTPVPEESRS